MLGQRVGNQEDVRPIRVVVEAGEGGEDVGRKMGICVREVEDTRRPPSSSSSSVGDRGKSGSVRGPGEEVGGGVYPSGRRSGQIHLVKGRIAHPHPPPLVLPLSSRSRIGAFAVVETTHAPPPRLGRVDDRLEQRHLHPAGAGDLHRPDPVGPDYDVTRRRHSHGIHGLAKELCNLRSKRRRLQLCPSLFHPV